VVYGVQARQHIVSWAAGVHPSVPAIDPTTPIALIDGRGAAGVAAFDLPEAVFSAVVVDGIKTDNAVI